MRRKPRSSRLVPILSKSGAARPTRTTFSPVETVNLFSTQSASVSVSTMVKSLAVMNCVATATAAATAQLVLLVQLDLLDLPAPLVLQARPADLLVLPERLVLPDPPDLLALLV